MPEKITWLFIFLVPYWGFCIYWGVKSAGMAKTSGDFFVAGRKLSLWVFVTAATATSFGGWIFLGQPALIFTDGIQFTFAALCAVTIPLAGTVFLKRQWMLGKRFGYLTPGEMLTDYYQDHVIRFLLVFISLVFAIPFLGLLLGASGYIFSIVSDNWISRDHAVWLLSVVLVIYVSAGGIRGVATTHTLQGLLLLMGVAILGLIALDLVGGFENLNRSMAKLANETNTWGTTLGHGGGDYNSGFSIPGVVQWSAGLGREAPTGGLWTGVMCLSFMFAFMGVQSSPTFSLLAFSSKSPKAFAPQQVWASALVVGMVLVFSVTFQGMAAHFLGANVIAREAGLMVTEALPVLTGEQVSRLVPYYISSVAAVAPWMTGLLAVCGLAALQSSGAAYMNTAGTLLARDIYHRHINPDATKKHQVLFARLSILIVTLLALLMSTYAQDAILTIGGLALAFAFQIWPALLGVTWIPWITRQGASIGMLAGMVAVILTDPIGQKITGNTLPWGSWPWTIHSAGWGIFFNICLCIIVSAMSQNPKDRAHRMKFHEFLRQHSGSTIRPWQKTLAWIVTITWIFFAIGPGIVIGNYLFGTPEAGHEGWDLNIPSLWGWVIIWWGLGVTLLWYLAYKLELSTDPAKPVP